jgi:hypothetical protein
MARTLDYEQLIQLALLGVVKKVLIDASKNGLPGLHHFYITFRTDHPDVIIPHYLKDQYPESITIIIQYEFWDLDVSDDHFQIILSFNTIHERLIIPFNAITNFVDPHAKYGLQFTPVMDEIEKPAATTTKISAKKEKPKTEKNVNADHGSNVVTLDAFRKKPKT